MTRAFSFWAPGRRVQIAVGVFALTALAAGPAGALASSTLGTSANNMMNIVAAMHAYRENTGTLPTDIYDHRGKPLLSWRVRLLPFVESDDLARQFHLDEPWDSPHNRQLIPRLPRIYRPPGGRPGASRAGETGYLRPCGEGTLFLRDHPGVTGQGPGDPSRQIWLVEVDEDHAVTWTKPGDLDYDPAHPTAGLNQRYTVGLFQHRGSLAAFGDEKVHLLNGDADPDLLRPLFSASGTGPAGTVLPWYAAFIQSPWCQFAVPSLMVSLVAVAGAVPVAGRVLRRRATPPGEFLWLIAGVTGLAYLLAFASCFRVRAAPELYGKRELQQLALWFVPRLAGTLAGLVPLLRYRWSPAWRALFLGNFGLWSVVALDSSFYDWNLWPEESLVTAAPPVVLGVVGVAAVLLTPFTREDVRAAGRPLGHWGGILVYLAPALWFAVCWSAGLVEPRPLFVRVLD